MTVTGGPLDSSGLAVLQASAIPPRRRSWREEGGLKSLSIAAVSSVVVFTLLGLVVVNAPGWEAMRDYYFSSKWFTYAWPQVVDAFTINVQLFLIAEAIILVFALMLAVFRSLPGPVFFPLRLLATVYCDIFRALPGLLIISMLGIGIPSLQIAGVPSDAFFWAVVALSLVYSAYVAEVYRAGIESIHPSQEAAARSLGLSRFQALRYVILPQAVRRVIPPLLNDFIGLQKDTVLVSYVGVVEGFRQASMIQAGKFNATSYVALALVFLIITIPLARFTDWLVAHDRRRFMAGAR